MCLVSEYMSLDYNTPFESAAAPGAADAAAAPLNFAEPLPTDLFSSACSVPKS